MSPHTGPPVLQLFTLPVPEHVELATLAHATPLLQQASPHGVVFGGHPHLPVEASRQATPFVQQHDPHGVWPARHGAACADPGPEQTTEASPRNGLNTLAATAPAAAIPNIFRTPRRDVVPANCRLMSSNRSLTCHPPWTRAPV